MSKKKARWRKLDNAAKLYSAASNKKDTRVFRFYCELKEEVNPDVLQEALNQTIEIFPTFLMVLRKGLFWHYLEPCNLRPIVKEEYKEPCSRLYIKDKKTLLFEVTYYKKRINFEVFHVLTDGDRIFKRTGKKLSLSYSQRKWIRTSFIVTGRYDGTRSRSG